MDELKPCSTCGCPGIPIDEWPHWDSVYCNNSECPKYDIVWTRKTWQLRKVEDAQSEIIAQQAADLKSCAQIIADLKFELSRMIDKSNARADTIAQQADTIRKLTAQVERMREALEFYGNHLNYVDFDTPGEYIIAEDGSKAREALRDE